MSVWNSPSEWQKYLESKYDSEETLEGHIRQLGKTYLRNWRSAELFPVIGYDEELMEADPASFAGCLRDIEIKIKKFQDESDDVRPLFGDFTTTCEPD